jgi:TRAP-type C4-dicarboxylate transport system permease small subunit
VKKLYDRLVTWEARIAASFLVLMVVLIFVGGVARLVGYPLNWTTDTATCLFAWACFLCADIAWRKNSLMSIDLVTNLLPDAGRRFLLWCNYAIIAAFLLYAMVAGAWLSFVSRARSFQGIPEISYSWVTMSMSVGGLLLLVTTVLKCRDELRKEGPKPIPGERRGHPRLPA